MLGIKRAMASSSSVQTPKPFTFDGFAEELANTSTTYKRPGDGAFPGQDAAKNAPPPPGAIGSQKGRPTKRPPPGFEKKIIDNSNVLPNAGNKNDEPDTWYGQPKQGQHHQPNESGDQRNPFTNNSEPNELNQFFMQPDSRNKSGDQFADPAGPNFRPGMNNIQNMFQVPGPFGDGSPRGTESPSNPMFGMGRSPHSSGGSNSSMGNPNQMMQQLMGMISQNPAMAHMFTPMNPMMNMMNMNPAMVQAMMNMMVSMNQFQNMTNMHNFMATFQKWANSGQFPPNMESMISNLGVTPGASGGPTIKPKAVGGDTQKVAKTTLDHNSSNVNTSSSPNSSFDSETKVKMSPRTQERLTNIYDEINSTHRLIERLNLELNVNGPELVIPKCARYFIIKSFTEEDVHRAVKYKMWCSTYYGNRRLESAYDNIKKSYGDDGEIYLFFSVNASGHFCGVAKMISRYDPDAKQGMDVWCKDEHNEGGKNSKWRGMFQVKWVYVKDIPNTEFTNLKVTKNGGKPFPHSRDTQEIEASIAIQALKIFHGHKQNTSLLDDFDHYNRMEEKQHTKDKLKSYKYLGHDDKEERRDSGTGDLSRGNGRGSCDHDARRSGQRLDRHVKTRRDGSVGESTIKCGIIDDAPVPHTMRLGAARNPEYERDAIHMPSPERSGPFFEDLPGVLSKLKPDSVTKILAANGPKNNGGKYVPVDEQINSSQNIEKIPRKIPGQPGPNAIPIVKPKDHDYNNSRSEHSTPEKPPRESRSFVPSVTVKKAAEVDIPEMTGLATSVNDEATRDTDEPTREDQNTIEPDDDTDDIIVNTTKD